MDSKEILLVHPGGLGDLCLSESTFLSLASHFGPRLVGIGYQRFFTLFCQYFSRIERFDSRQWLPLFVGDVPPGQCEQVILIGKDRQGNFRKNLQAISRERLIFIDMYPSEDKAIPVHVEEYQLNQLESFGINAQWKEIIPQIGKTVILYPEAGYKKRKWPKENFLSLFHELAAKGIDVEILRQEGLDLDIDRQVFFHDVKEVRDYFSSGGIFVSNDSGVAHLAGMSGLQTITLFTDHNPAVWRPRGRNISLRPGSNEANAESLLAHINSILGRQQSTE